MLALGCSEPTAPAPEGGLSAISRRKCREVTELVTGGGAAAPGIVTSEEYCELKIWPDGNARAWPVERGTVVIH